MSTPKYKLIYFDYMWLGEPIRYLLHYVKEDFEDVRLDSVEWDKPDGKIDKNIYTYQKLPILENLENGFKLGQSYAIARYLARKYNLAGKTEEEAAKCDEYADVVKDVLKRMEQMWDKDEKTKAELLKFWLEETVPRYFSVIESDLKKNGGKYLVGNDFTWVDFVLSHTAQLFTMYTETDVLANYPVIKEYQHQIFEIPQIKAYIAKRPLSPY
ncbi:unnamed protein product [Orchesella dallaii]